MNRESRVRVLTEEDVRRFLQDENVGFLSYMKEYCDIRRIATSLLSKKIIGRGQCESFMRASTPEEAASLCYSFLYSDPSVNKLEKLSTALREDEMYDSHSILARKIDQFLQQGLGERESSELSQTEPLASQTADQTEPQASQTADQTSQTHPTCLLYTSPSPRDRQKSRMPSSA